MSMSFDDFRLPEGLKPLLRDVMPQVQTPVPPPHDDTVHSGTGQLLGQPLSIPVSDGPPEPGDVGSLPPVVQQVVRQPQEALRGQMQAQLAPVPDLSPLYVPQPGTLATNPAVIDRLVAHAAGADTQLERHEIVGYAALGERAMGAMGQAVQSPPQLSLRVDGIVLTANMEVMRAISWYVAACAAQQDVNQQASGSAMKLGEQEITDLSICGAYVFNDPGNVCYDFMNSCPLIYPRISTHFNERSDSLLSASGQADQRGIEDYRRRLPGENGTILFDKLKDGDKKQIFFKFEWSGMPTRESMQQTDDQGEGSAGWGEGYARVASHALSFITTRIYQAPGVERKEHVYKGLLKALLYDPFLNLVQQAQALSLLEMHPHETEVINRGLPYLEETLGQIKKVIEGQISGAADIEALRKALLELEEKITHAKGQLGAQSNHLGITRRGAETHVDLNPTPVHLKNAQDSFARLQDGAKTCSHEQVTQDWRQHGIRIGDVFYDGQGLPAEQAYESLLQVCGRHAAAADWISRFARQDQAQPLLEYLHQESLGEMGRGLALIGGQGIFTIQPQTDGVDLRWDFLYAKSGETPLEIRQGDKPPRRMDDAARLQASVVLRFENLASFVAGTPPAPKIIQPLTYSLSNFRPAIVMTEDGYEMIERDADEPPAP